MIPRPPRSTLFPTRRSSDLQARCRDLDIGAEQRAGAAHARADAPRFIAGKDRKSTRLNSSHEWISYAVFCLKKKKKRKINRATARCPNYPERSTSDQPRIRR